MRRRHGSLGNSGGPHTRPSPSEARWARRGPQRLLLVVTLAGALLLASACEVDVGVDIDVAENGSGTVSVGVSLNRAAADALGDLVNQIDLDDLALAGWDVTGPAREADNLLWLRATKPFGNPEELPSILAEIAGPDVFGGFELRRRAEFAEQTWEMVGQVDPAAAFPELLDTLDFNRGLEEQIRNAVGGAGDDALTSGLTMHLGIDLPGDLRSGGDSYGWDALSADSPAPAVQVRLVATEENTTAKTLRLVGLAAAALFILALLLNLLGWWYVRRHRKRGERALLARADSEQLPVVLAGSGSSAREADPLPPADDDGSWGAIGAGQPAGELEAPVETGTVTIDDDIDWAELEGAEFEDLSGGLAGPADDLAVPGTEASADDWTASLEATPPGDVEAGPGDEDPEWVGAEWLEPEPAERPEPSTADQGAPPPGRLFQPAENGGTFADALGAASAESEPAEEAEPAPPAEPEPAAEPAPPAEPEAPHQAEPTEVHEADTDETVAEEPHTEEPEPGEPDDASESDLTERPAVVSEPDEPEPAAEPEPTEPAPADEPEPAADEPETMEEVPGEAPDVPEAAPTAPAAPPSRALRLVVIGGWGVLFQPADPAGELLLPFVRQAGSTATPAEIREAYRLATLGLLTPAQLWEACGLGGEPDWTHGPYSGRMTVSDGAPDFIRSLLRRGVGVGCVTNDVSEWSWRLRGWTGFEAVTPWVISGDIGIRKPDPGVFEMLRRVSEVPFANCLVIDSDHRTLDAARSLGMSTALFGSPAVDQAPIRTAHPTVGDFAALLRRGRRPAPTSQIAATAPGNAELSPSAGVDL